MSDPKKDFLDFAKPLARGIYEYALDTGRAQGVTEVRVAVSAGEELQNAVEKGALSKSVSGQTSRVSVTLYAGDRTLSFTKSSADAQAILRAIDANLKVIHMVPPNADKRLLEKERVYQGAREDLDLFDATPVASSALRDYALEVEKAAMAQPKVKTARSVSASKGVSHVYVLASNGLEYSDHRTMYSAGASVIAQDQSGMQVDGESTVARHFSDMAAAGEIGAAAGKNAAAKLGAELPATGQMPVVLDHDAAESFFGAAFGALYGSAIHRGASMFKDKIGQSVMSAQVTIEDDPLVRRGINSRSVDSAGLKMDKITFIDKGVLKSYSVSLMESRQLGIDPVGREGGRTNSRVTGGTQTPEEIMADIKEGIYIKGFSGGQVDINNGTHSRQAHGLLIRDGKVTDIPVSGFVVSGNLKEMFMNVVLANDTPRHPGRHTLAAPTTRINGVTIAGR